MALTGEPAGTVATRAAGLAEFRAVFEWEAPEGGPRRLTAPGGPLGGPFRLDLTHDPSPCGTRLEVSGSLRAMRDPGGALAGVMRRAADAAAVWGAVLEMRVLREARPRPFPPDLVQALATDLWRAGFPVRFGPCWAPVGGTGLALGVRGEEEALLEFLRDHPEWGPERGPS